MKELIKKIMHYKLNGIESAIYIGNFPIRFKRKKVILHRLDSLNIKMEKLLQEKETIKKLFEDKKKYSEIQEEKAQLLEVEIERLKVLISSQEQALNNQKTRYVESYWCTGWIEYWKTYLTENIQTIGRKINDLKVGVDNESNEIIDLFLERNFYMMPIQKYAEFFLYDRSRIFSEWEINGMNEGMNEADIMQKYQLDSGMWLETPVFKFHCGILLLPLGVQKQIKGKDIIDGGAFWGDSALVLQEYSPKSIHAFEPMPVNFKQLCEMKRKKQLDLLYPVQAGLGQKNSERTLYHHEMLSGASVVNYKAIMNESPDTHSDNIDIVTIDSYTSTNGLDVGLIKLDIEGSELEAIKGAIETICKYKPILLISVYHLPKDFFEIKPLLESLNLGYQFMFRKLVYHDPMTEVSLIAYVPK
ncbi:FkbM family methyltransferase [Clostridiales bacterium TF09-2AC]|nr:FkbM family methyltransferase [Clostridiales bacterium TF09-2AC]